MSKYSQIQYRLQWGFLILCVTVLNGCATIGSRKVNNTHALQDDFIVAILKCDELSEREQDLYASELKASSKGSESPAIVMEALVTGLQRELLEESVVNSSYILNFAYSLKVQEFYKNITEAVGADGIISDVERTVLSEFQAKIVPLVDPMSLFTHTNHSFSSDLIDISNKAVEHQKKQIASELSERLFMDILVVGGVNQAEVNTLKIKSDIGTAFFQIYQAFQVPQDPSQVTAFVLTEAEIRSIAPHVSPQPRDYNFIMSEVLDFDGQLSLAEFERYNFIANTLSDEIQKLSKTDEVEGEKSQISFEREFTPIDQSHFDSINSPRLKATPRNKAAPRNYAYVRLDILRANGVSEDLLEFQKQLIKYTTWKEGPAWGHQERQDLLFETLKKNAELLIYNVEKNGDITNMSLYDVLDELGFLNTIVENGEVSEAMKTLLRDYSSGFEEGGEARIRFLGLCPATDRVKKDSENMAKCEEDYNLLANKIHEVNKQFTDPEHAEAKEIEERIRRRREGLVAEARDLAERELKMNLKDIMRAQERYKQSYEEAVAWKAREDSGDVTEARTYISKKRYPYTAEERRSYFKQHRGELTIPAKHTFDLLYSEPRGSKARPTGLKPIYESIKADPTSFVTEQKKFNTTCAGFCGGYRIEITDEQFQDDFYAYKRFASQLTPEQIKWQRASWNGELNENPSALLEEIRALKIGELSGQWLRAPGGFGLEDENDKGFGEDIHLVVQYVDYKPSSSKWKDLRHADELNQRMSAEEELRSGRVEREQLLKHPYPIAVEPYPKRESGEEPILWDEDASGGFKLLSWSRIDIFTNTPSIGRYWIETEPALDDQPARYTIYGRVDMPFNVSDVVYSLASDEKDMKLVDTAN